LFYLLSLLYYVRGEVRASFFAFAAALLSKGMAVTLPLTLLVLDFYPLKRKAWLEKLPFFALFVVFGVIGFFGQQDIDQGRFPYPDSLGRLAQAAYGLVFYVVKTVAPISLSPLYLRPKEIALAAWPFSACAALVALASAALVLSRKKK